MTYFIYSTHTNPVNYVEYEKNSNAAHNIIKRRFFVAGGHGLCDKHLFTPQGIVTRVESQEDMDWLESLDSFKRDIEKGYIRVSKKEEKSEKMVKNMVLKDGSSPKTPADYKVTDAASRSFSTGNMVNIPV